MFHLFHLFHFIFVCLSPTRVAARGTGEGRAAADYGTARCGRRAEQHVSAFVQLQSGVGFAVNTFFASSWGGTATAGTADTDTDTADTAAADTDTDTAACHEIVTQTLLEGDTAKHSQHPIRINKVIESKQKRKICTDEIWLC